MKCTGAEWLTVEVAFYDIEFFEIWKTRPFGRNPALELVVVGSIWVVGPELQRLERAWEHLWQRACADINFSREDESDQIGCSTLELIARHVEVGQIHKFSEFLGQLSCKKGIHQLEI